MSSASANSEFVLFPVPSNTPPSPLSPRTWPGVSPASTAALQKVLTENHEKWHIFFNDRGMHNHISHHALANWSLGASAAIIEAGYQQAVGIQRPLNKSPGEITVQNFTDHVADGKYYDAYLTFFTNVVKAKGSAAAVEEYIFSTKANFDPARTTGEQPQMLNRLLASLLHPIIHLGYGLEFGLPGMVIEGLAQTYVHPLAGTKLMPSSFFGSNLGPVDKLASGLSTLSLTAGTDVHAFTVLARILKDDEFDARGRDPATMYEAVMKEHGESLWKYAEQWTIDVSKPDEIDNKIQELAWTNIILYGVGGWRGGDFRADFFLMHLVTSSAFIPSIVPYLSPRSQALLLRAYFAVCLGWWVAVGRPALDIKSFYTSSAANLTPSGPLPTPHKESLLPPTHPDAVTPNSWLPIIETSMVYTESHLPKLQRTLAQYGAKYGTRIAGLPDFAGTELEGADFLDGTLFIRTAGLTAQRMGRVREGEAPPQFWDMNEFYQ